MNCRLGMLGRVLPTRICDRGKLIGLFVTSPPSGLQMQFGVAEHLYSRSRASHQMSDLKIGESSYFHFQDAGSQTEGDSSE